MRTERGLALGIALVVAMAAGALVLGLTGAFPDHDRSGPEITVAGRLPHGPASGVAYRLVPPRLTRDDAARIFTAVGITAPVRRAAGIYFAGRGRGTITRTALGWFVETRDLAEHDPRGEAPTTDTALAVARRVAKRLGIPADLVTSIHRAGSTTRTVAIARLLGNETVPALQWTVFVGPGGSLEGVSGYVVNVRPVGRVAVEPAESVVQRLGTAHATAPVDHLALWAVTVGTNVMGYTPVYGSSVKYVLIGKKEVCTRPSFESTNSGKPTRLGFVPDPWCIAQTSRSLIVTSGRRTLGAVTVNRGRSALLVPAYEFTFHPEPVQRGPRDHTISVAAVDDATLKRLAS